MPPKLRLILDAHDLFASGFRVGGHSLSRRDADIALRPSLRPPEELIGKRIATIAHVDPNLY